MTPSPPTISPPFAGPSRVLMGAGAVASIGSELRVLGANPERAPVLLVADEALLKLGLTVGAETSLRKAGFDLRVGPGVTAEPTPAVVEALAGACEVTPVAVIGFGGGSAIDASKLAASSYANQLQLTVGMKATDPLSPPPLLASIPTTAGTGAEATAVAMLWHEGKKRIFVHPLLVPRHATLDPDLLASVPRPIVAASGLDAISHAVESLLSEIRTPLTVGAAESALRGLAGSLRPEYEGTAPATRQELSLGAFQAGLALNASVVIGHSIAYAIAARTGLSHGVTCAMALPYCLAYSRPAAQDQIDRIAAVLGVADDAALMGWIGTTIEALDVPPTLAEVGIEADELDAMAAEICEVYPRPNSPVPLEPAAVTDLLRHFHRGSLDAAWDATTER